jgi:hypothetical protein
MSKKAWARLRKGLAMSFRRIFHPTEFASGERLTSDLVGIGFRLAAPSPKSEPNIEDTLFAASREGMLQEDYRVLALLVDWFSIHVERVNVDRMRGLAASSPDKPVKAFWAAIASWQRKDPRMKKLSKIHSRRPHELLGERGDFLIQRNGEDERFKGSCLRVPAKTLRHRSQDLLSGKELAKRHRAYYWRVLIGPSYRADMWAILDHDPSLSAAEVARRSYGSFPTAWQVKRDWLLLHGRQELERVS